MRKIAKISTNGNERVFKISQWYGVNEAPEGEAALKSGEAAVMRNFCVTSGGALKKRPGSRNVAGFLDKYTPHVREGAARCLFTETGIGPGHELYPRMECDQVGAVRCAGAAVTADGESAGGRKGYFLPLDGLCWALDRVERSGVAGGEAISGGTAVPGTLSQLASGTLNTKTNVYGGVRYVDTWPEAVVDSAESGVRVTGQTTRRDAPARRSTGWETQDAGGWLTRDGKLWKYYGARVDTCRSGYVWNKYRCAVSTVNRVYYEEGTWKYVDASTLMTTDPSRPAAVGGDAGYRFNESTGKYYGTGGTKRIYAGESGTVYVAAGDNECYKTEVSRTGAYSSVVQTYRAVSYGPYTKNITEYTRGASLGTVDTLDSAVPDGDKGYTYVDDFTLDGESYTVMRFGQDYYCYARTSDQPDFYDLTYSFHGYPMTVTADTYRWYFNETYAQAAGEVDAAVRGIWSGFVKGREVLCAACGGALWELREQDGVWTRVSAGEMDTSRDVYMFGFDEKLYILNGVKYMVWDGERLEEVEGYRPLVAVAAAPAGGGTLLENVNRLTAGRRAWFSPDGEAKTFQLPEKDIKSVDWVKDLTETEVSGIETAGSDAVGAGSKPARAMAIALSDYIVDLEKGTVTFSSAPARGVNSLEIAWSAGEDYRGQVCAMRFAELYNGAQDSRVFLYGNGTNRAIYSGLDYDGKPRADYFPDLYEVSVGDANTPVTAMIRHYDKLMVFKQDSAWSVGYDTITLMDGTVTAGFYVAPVNRSIGSCAWGQAQLVQNRPRTLDGRSVIEWLATGSSGITGDQRNAQRVSQRVDASIRKFDLSRARTFYDKFSHEYFVIGEDGTAIVQNLDVDAWYVYTGLRVTCMINYRDELYYGTGDGYLRHFSDRYFSDNGEPIDAYWESGAMSMGEDFRRKYSAMVWIGIRPEDNGYLEVTAQTDRKSDFAVYDVRSLNAAGVPEMDRIKLKAKKFTYYKLILRNDTADRTATVVSADIRVRGTGYVR